MDQTSIDPHALEVEMGQMATGETAPMEILEVDGAREAGVVYTKPWTVELILDLVGYTPDKPLAEMVALEPSAGDGAFLRGMVRRLVASCRKRKISLEKAESSIRAFEIDPAAAHEAVEAVQSELRILGVESKTAGDLARKWVRVDDFLEVSLGFPVADFVLGNPPYIRLEDIPESKAQLYRRAYDTMRGRSDIYVAFYQAALNQLKPGGVCAYICADRWLLNEYGKGLRKFITHGFSVRHIVEMHDVDAFESEVAAYPAITVIAHEKQGAVTVSKALQGIEARPSGEVMEAIDNVRSTSFLRVAQFESWFKGDEPWPCSSPEALLLLKHLEGKFAPLESSLTDTRVGIGVATGADGIYVQAKRVPIEDDRLLPLALGHDLVDGRVQWSGHYLVNPWRDSQLVEIDDYPRMSEFLRPHHVALSRRHTAQDRPNAWYKTIDKVNHTLFEKQKLYIADIRDRLLPALDEGRTYPHHNVYWITSRDWDLRVLGALLMSEVGEFFVHSYGVKMRGGYFRFQAQYLRRIRVPVPQDIPGAMAKRLADAFDSYDSKRATRLALEIYGIDRIPR